MNAEGMKTGQGSLEKTCSLGTNLRVSTRYSSLKKNGPSFTMFSAYSPSQQGVFSLKLCRAANQVYRHWMHTYVEISPAHMQ